MPRLEFQSKLRTRPSQAREFPVNGVRGSLILRRADGYQKAVTRLLAAVPNLVVFDHDDLSVQHA